MFGNKTFSINLLAVLVLCTIFGISSGAPIARRGTPQNDQLVKRQAPVQTNSLVPLIPGSTVSPVIVDLFDQYQNFQKQLSEATEGSPGYDALQRQVATAKLLLETKMRGLAEFASNVSGPSATITPAASATGAGPSGTVTVWTTTTAARASPTSSSGADENDAPVPNSGAGLAASPAALVTVFAVAFGFWVAL